jgi:hypothetical protein
MKVSFRSFVSAIALVLGITASTFADESVLSSSIKGDAEASRVATVYSVDDAGLATAPQENVVEGGSGEYFDEGAYSVGDDFYTYYSRTGGLIGGGEASFLRPYATDRVMTITDADMGFEFAYRAWIGYQSEEGLGGRLRYFQFDNTATGVRGFNAIEFKTIDAEMTQRVDFRRWNLLFSGGVRQAESSYEFFDVRTPPNLEMAGGFAGVGLTFGAQATRELNATGALQLVASARWSSLFGNANVGLNIPGRAPHDELISIFEITFGPQYQFELASGALLTVYGGLETQTWTGALNDGNDDIGLAGFSGGISILR